MFPKRETRGCSKAEREQQHGQEDATAIEALPMLIRKERRKKAYGSTEQQTVGSSSA